MTESFRKLHLHFVDFVRLVAAFKRAAISQSAPRTIVTPWPQPDK